MTTVAPTAQPDLKFEAIVHEYGWACIDRNDVGIANGRQAIREYLADRVAALDAEKKAGAMLAESAGEALKLLRAIQKDLWDRARVDQVAGTRVVSLSHSVWRRLCDAMGEPE